MDFDSFLERIDNTEPISLADSIPRYSKPIIIGFCHMCGSGRTVDAIFCHFCGFRFDMSNLKEVISLHNSWGSHKND